MITLTGQAGLKAVAVCCGFLVLGGCSSIPTAGQAWTDLNRTVGNYPVGELPTPNARSAWPDLASDVRGQRARGFGLIPMPEMQAYLNGLYQRIKQAAGVPDWPGSVYITARNELDVYCTAAGNMYISIGWLQSAQTEDEVVALMSHELGHVFANTQQLEGGLVAADRTAMVALVVLTLAKKLGDKQGWSQLDSLAIGYTMARESLAPAWSRGEEDAADRFGVTVSLRMGYSYSAGFKSFLERQLTWEQENDARQQALREQALLQKKKNIFDATNVRLQPRSDAQKQLANVNTVLNSTIADAGDKTSYAISEVLKLVTNNHPDTQKRLDSLTADVQVFMAGKPRASASEKPWDAARRQPRTAATLKSYQSVADAQEALQKKDVLRARSLALKASAGATARQALPTLELAWAEAADARANQNARTLELLDRNLQSESDRSWRLYVLRANALLAAGQSAQATKVMTAGFDYFAEAPYAWPDQIAFYGQINDWLRAKKLAGQCGDRFPSHRNACQAAALSPADIAKQKAASDQKAKSLVDKWSFGKK